MLKMDVDRFEIDDDDDGFREKAKSAPDDPGYDADYAQYLYKELWLSSLSSNDGEAEFDVGGEGEGETDTHLKMFLDTIVADGASFVLKRPGKPDLKFEGMDADADADDDDDRSCGFYHSAANEVELVELSSDSESQQRRSKGRKDKGLLRAERNGKIQTSAKGVGKKRSFVESDEDFMVQQVDVMSEKRGGKTVKNGKARVVENVDLVQVERRGKNVEKPHRFEQDESHSLLKQKGSRNVVEIEKLKRKPKNVEKNKSSVENKTSNSVEDLFLRQCWRDVKENGKTERRANNFSNVDKEKRSLSENIRAKEIDPNIKAFFDLCEREGDDLILVANGKRLKYGEDDNSDLSDSEVYVLDHAPDCRESNYAPTLNSDAHMEDDDLQCLGSCNPAENPLFRKAVIDILGKPFNFKEYQRLRNDVKRRKPIVRHVDMRSGNTSFQQSTLGKSYLDHYTDLKKQYDAFKKNIPKRLNILRGFFFYLERAADDGKFKPWLDDSCLAIIPRTD